MKLCYSYEYLLFILLEQLKHLKNLLANQFFDPFEMAEYFYDNGILPEQSYLAVMNFFPYYGPNFHPSFQPRMALVNLLFEELVDPATLDNFKEYARSEFSQSFELLNSMGKYCHDNCSYFISIL